MSIPEIVACISAVCALAALYHTIKNTKKNDVKDIEQRTAERVETNMKLDEIARNVADIKETLNEQKKTIEHLTEKVAVVDAKADKAHLRIDMLEDKLKEDE